MSETIIIKIAESAEIVIDITDKMVSDYRECRSQSEKVGCDGKDCNTCSLNTTEDVDWGLCELPIVKDAIEGED